MRHHFDDLDILQLMAEGGQGGGEGQAEAGGDGQDAAGNETPAAAPEDLNAEFDALVKGDGKYRDVYGKRVQKAVFERMKGTKAAVDRLNSFSGAFEVLAARYGCAPDDPELANKIAQDTGLLDEVAMKNGRDPGTEMELARARAQSEQANALIQRILADQEMQRWQAEAAELQAKYPDFNLDEQMQNPDFADLLRNHNVTLEGAYMALNHDKVIQQTVRRAEKRVTDTVAAGKNRPRENGMGSQAGAAMSKDPMQMSTAEIRKWQEAVARGERVSFAR